MQINPNCRKPSRDHQHLPKENEGRGPGTECMLSVWGDEQVDGENAVFLQQIPVSVVGQKVCNDRNDKDGTGLPVTKNMMCSRPSSGQQNPSYHANSVGPLSCQTSNKEWKLFGMMNWGSDKCDGLEVYAVHTKISSYVKWIYQHTK